MERALSRGSDVQEFRSSLRPGPEFARRLDEADPLSRFRDRFDLPGSADDPHVYLVGNSLGPLPKAAREAVEWEVGRWASLGVDGWFESPGWYGLEDRLLPPLARLVGARSEEVAIMNGLTVNLHLLLATFFRPEGSRTRILIERPCFPSDRFAVETHLRWHGLDPDAELMEVGPDDDGEPLDEADIERALEGSDGRVALVLLSGVNFLTGQCLDMPRIVRAARNAGAAVGFDLAHAVGNVPLQLHDWDVDFAAWCHYKYVNAGPGAPAGIFVHERHSADRGTRRLGGWWGNDPEIRFRMQLDPSFVPRADAGGWQISCPPVVALAPLGPALGLFDEAGPERLREKSLRLTAYLEWLLTPHLEGGGRILTPPNPERRGAQLSIRLPAAEQTQKRLQEAGVIGDFRQPDVLRLAPCPLFNTYGEMWRAGEAFRLAAKESN